MTEYDAAVQAAQALAEQMGPERWAQVAHLNTPERIIARSRRLTRYRDRRVNAELEYYRERYESRPWPR